MSELFDLMFFNENNCVLSCLYFCFRLVIFFFNFKIKFFRFLFFMWSVDSFFCSLDINKFFLDFLKKLELDFWFGVFIFVVFGIDVVLFIFVWDELLYIVLLFLFIECLILLNFDFKFFVIVVVVKCGVGGGCLWGEFCFYVKIFGIVFGLGLILLLRFFFKFLVLKCFE